jgi:transcription initiation factor TFIID subunit 8
MSEKRSLTPDGGVDLAAKRARTASPQQEYNNTPEAPTRHEVNESEESEREGERATESTLPTHHNLARCGIQRSIAMVLKHDGFQTATPEAMESFTAMVETYLESLIEETKRLAIGSRRDHPIPSDFEAMLRRFNLPISSLKPHIRHPIPKRDVVPQYVDLEIDDKDAHTTLPLLGEELSGQPDKQLKPYIPSSFPDFPSKHTFKFTPQEDTNTRDPKKIREDAARSAQQGEEALRRLVRASKVRKQKEAKTQVESDSHGKERFRLWECTMKRLMGKDGRTDQVDEDQVAEHSMIVNGDALFSRRETSRIGKRTGPMTTVTAAK